MLNILCQALFAATDNLCFGLVICTAEGRVLHANRVAEDMFENGWPIRRRNDVLWTAERKRVDVLLAGLRQVSGAAMTGDSSRASLHISLASVRSPRGIAAATLRPILVQEHCLVAVYVTTPAARQESGASAIAQCYGLTPAEERTLKRFTEGMSVVQAAKALSISQNTVKTHLRNIFIKTNSSRQQQLLMLASGMRPPLCPPPELSGFQRRSTAPENAGLSPYATLKEPAMILTGRSA